MVYEYPSYQWRVHAWLINIQVVPRAIRCHCEGSISIHTSVVLILFYVVSLRMGHS